METLENILSHWDTDARIDQTEPSKELIRIPILHSKYLRMLTEHKVASKRTNFEYQKARKLRWEYYNGKLDQHQLAENGWEPFPFTLKAEVNIYLDSDEFLIKVLQKKIAHDECISVLEAIMKELGQRSWELKEYIRWEMFINGQ